MTATGDAVQFLSVGAGAQCRRIAYRQAAASGSGPGVIWLCGFHSEMTSTKASVLADWAAEQGLSCLRFDYSGHGQSEAGLQEGSISRWLEEAQAVFSQLSHGPQLLVGSSMGGYIALSAAARLAGAVGIRSCAHQGPGADCPGLGHDRAVVDQPAGKRAPGARGNRGLSAPIAL